MTTDLFYNYGTDYINKIFLLHLNTPKFIENSTAPLPMVQIFSYFYDADTDTYNSKPSETSEGYTLKQFNTLNEVIETLENVGNVVNADSKTFLYTLVKTSSLIAKESRRGLGNCILINDSTLLPNEVAERFNIFTDASLDPNYVCIFYKGSHGAIDTPALMVHNKYLMHPNYKNYMKKLKIK